MSVALSIDVFSWAYAPNDDSAPWVPSSMTEQSPTYSASTWGEKTAVYSKIPVIAAQWLMQERRLRCGVSVYITVPMVKE